MLRTFLAAAFCLAAFSTALGQATDPDTAPKAEIDRFSESAGTLFIRDDMNGLPGPGEPIDFDQGPFITRGLGPDGQSIRYYNFDVMPRETAPIFALFHEGADTPVEGQLNLVDVIPGDEGYSDFWHVHKVTVPADYEANTITSVEALMAAGYPIEKTNLVVNCPVVPEGSTAELRLKEEHSNELIRGWYNDQVIYYFDFSEKTLMVDVPDDGPVLAPISPIYVAFNINPDQAGGGPPSGFVTEEGSDQTHNVTATVPSDDAYSPLWSVNVYDNADFDEVYHLASAQAANVLATGVASPNCPVVWIGGRDASTASEPVVDRFSDDAGTLFIRDDMNGLPQAGEPIDFDQAPFITRGLGPEGSSIQYYNFDVMPRETAPIFALFREGADAPVDGQLNLVDVIPGDEGYSDFWHVHKVTVPTDYEANTITSVEALMAAGYPIEKTNLVVNCPVVPEGSTAELRLRDGNTNGLIEGWYKGRVIHYFDFSEKTLMVDVPDDGPVLAPVSPIYVTFNINPGNEGGGPASGFVTEDGSDQTHNVTATLPDDDAYSPLWSVNVYDNADFADVHDLASAQSANILANGVALPNCPVVSIMMDTAAERLPREVPARFALHGNYPNPFNPATTIRYDLSESGRVVLRIYDLLGRAVADVVDTDQAAGAYEVTWDAHDSHGSPVASGVYLYRVSVDGNWSAARQMTIMK